MPTSDIDPAVLVQDIDRFGETWNYDVSYMRALALAAPESFARFSGVTQMVDRAAAPAEALLAAGLAGTLAEDCGPCAQLGIDMALAGGVKADVARAIVAGDEAGMGEGAALAWRFARASLARDMEAADPLRDEIVRRWGQAGLCAIALQLTAARMYPTLKYALGYGKACSKLVVGEVTTPVAGAARAA